MNDELRAFMNNLIWKIRKSFEMTSNRVVAFNNILLVLNKHEMRLANLFSECLAHFVLVI